MTANSIRTSLDLDESLVKEFVFFGGALEYAKAWSVRAHDRSMRHRMVIILQMIHVYQDLLSIRFMEIKGAVGIQVVYLDADPTYEGT